MSLKAQAGQALIGAAAGLTFHWPDRGSRISRVLMQSLLRRAMTTAQSGYKILIKSYSYNYQG
jgi:hypothetical protein